MPGGPSGSIQYNNSGAFGGDADFTFDATNDIVTLAGAFPRFRISESGLATNLGRYQIESNAGTLSILGSNADFSGYSLGIAMTQASDGAIDHVHIEARSTYIDMLESSISLSTIDLVDIVVANGGVTGSLNIESGVAALQASSQAYVIAPELFLSGSVAWKQSATAPAIATSGTIDTTNVGTARLAPASAVTGIIIEAGINAGQRVTVINQSAAINSITMAASGTSNVANGVTCVIAGLTAKSFVWNSVTALWYPES